MQGGWMGRQPRASNEWNYILIKCCNYDVFFYCGATDTCCLDLMRTYLRGACNYIFSDARERWSTAIVISGTYLSSIFVGWPTSASLLLSLTCSLQNISRFSLEPGFLNWGAWMLDYNSVGCIQSSSCPGHHQTSARSWFGLHWFLINFVCC